MLVALRRGQLARADLAGVGVEAHHRLGPGPAGRGADLDELGQGLERGVVAGELAPQGTAGGHHQVGQLQRGGVLGRHFGRGHVLQRPHAPVGHVGQAVEGGDLAGRDALLGQLGRHQRIAEAVGQRVGQHGRQAPVGLFGELGELEDAPAGRHVQGRQLDAPPQPARVVLEGVVVAGRIRSDRPHGGAPGPHLNQVDLAVGH